MKTQTKKRFFGVVLASVLCSFNVVNAQFAGIFPPPFDDYRTTAPVTAVGIGNFGGANLPQSAFHINTNLSAPSSIFTSGEVFRTTGPTAQDNSWRMFTGAGNGTERFSITTPANSDDAVLSTVQNGAMQFATNGIERFTLSATGEVIINDLKCSDCLVMSNENGQLYSDNQTIKKLEDRITQLEQKLLELENLLANQQ